MEEYFKKIGAKHRIRDPLYGFIFLTDAELKIIDTPMFQRLRRIHQLALTKYVYPSAEHSRFVHSLGVMHCATLMMAGVFDHKYTKLNYEPSESLIKTLRFAALLHDVGHLPFSHAVEKQWLKGLSHEDLSQYIILHYPEISQVIADEKIDPKLVAMLLAKKPPASLNLAHQIISGQLDADRADYLLRDSHCCGVKYGEYDLVRYLQIFAAVEDQMSGRFSLLVDEADLHVAESFLVARYHYNLQIPFHRTRSGYDFVLRGFVKDIPKYTELFTIKNGHIEDVKFAELVQLDDYSIISDAKNNGSKWSEYLFRNKHLVPVIDTSSASKTGQNLFKNFVRRLSQAPSFLKEEDYFSQEQKVGILKWGTRPDQMQIDDSENNKKYGMITLRSCEGKGRSEELVDITDRSWIFKQLAEEPVRVYRVYVTPEKQDAAIKLLSVVETEDKEECCEW